MRDKLAAANELFDIANDRLLKVRSMLIAALYWLLLLMKIITSSTAGTSNFAQKIEASPSNSTLTLYSVPERLALSLIKRVKCWEAVEGFFS